MKNALSLVQLIVIQNKIWRLSFYCCHYLRWPFKKECDFVGSSSFHSFIEYVWIYCCKKVPTSLFLSNYVDQGSWICGIKTFTANKIAYFNMLIGFGKSSRLKTERIKESKSVKVKVKWALLQVFMLCTGPTAHRGSRGIALPFHDHGTRRGEGSASRSGRSLPPRNTRYPL